jgi:NADPH:quinone reductase-like Zn-dependent oxidoreductase
MVGPNTYSAFRRTTGDLPRTIELSSEVLPDDLGPTAVLIKIYAVSLNFRDVAMLTGRYPVQVEEAGIPVSDCAAEVVEIGSAVKDFKVGDRVTVIFDTANFTGLEDETMEALGGDVPGVLREFAVYEEKLLLKLPDHITWEEVGNYSFPVLPPS